MEWIKHQHEFLDRASVFLIWSILTVYLDQSSSTLKLLEILIAVVGSQLSKIALVHIEITLIKPDSETQQHC